jgi:hypothetical protein
MKLGLCMSLTRDQLDPLVKEKKKVKNFAKVQKLLPLGQTGGKTLLGGWCCRIVKLKISLSVAFDLLLFPKGLGDVETCLGVGEGAQKSGITWAF